MASETFTMFLDEYLCDVCGYKASAVFGQPAYYLFDDGEKIPALSEPAWCRTCAAVTLVEDLPDRDFLAAQLRRLQSGVIEDYERELAELSSTPVRRIVSIASPDMDSSPGTIPTSNQSEPLSRMWGH